MTKVYHGYVGTSRHQRTPENAIFHQMTPWTSQRQWKKFVAELSQSMLTAAAEFLDSGVKRGILPSSAVLRFSQGGVPSNIPHTKKNQKSSKMAPAASKTRSKVTTPIAAASTLPSSSAMHKPPQTSVGRHRSNATKNQDYRASIAATRQAAASAKSQASAARKDAAEVKRAEGQRQRALQLEERALVCKRKFVAAQKLAEASAMTASRTETMRQQTNPPSMTTRASSSERAIKSSKVSVGSSGRGGRRRTRNRPNNNKNQTGRAIPRRLSFEEQRQSKWEGGR